MITNPLSPTQHPLFFLKQNHAPDLPAHHARPQHHPPNQQTMSQIEESFGDDGYDYGGCGEEEQYEGAMMEVGAGGDQNIDFFSKHDESITSLVLDHGHHWFSCASCGNTSTKRSDLIRHVISKHVTTLAVDCQFCRKQYKNKTNLQVHISQGPVATLEKSVESISACQ